MKKLNFLWLMKMTAVVIAVVVSVQIVSAQTEYGDFTYEKKAIKERSVIPYPPLREADVMMMWRISRIIDSREKMNVIMKWPRSPFYRIIYESVTQGYGSAPITAYKNDSLISFYTAEEILKLGGEEEVIQIYPDPENYPDYYIDSTVINPFRPEKIIKYKIMEDYIFDKQRSMFYWRIIAIAPMYKPKVGGVELNEQEMFWVKWEDFRNILVSQEIFNRHNDAMRMNYLDWFEHRMFTSYITKESNAFDYSITNFEEFKSNTLEAFLESERIKEKLFMWEHDLWEW